MLARYYVTAVTGCVALMLSGCGSDSAPAPQDATRVKQSAGGQRRVTLYIPEMADRLEIL